MGTTIRFLIAGVFLLPLIARADPANQIGAIVPLTGELAPFGEIVRKGIEAAHLGTIHVVYEDDACLPEKAVSAYQKLSSVEHTKVFLGPCCTSAMAALAPLLKKNHQLAVNFCTGSEAMYDLSGGAVFHSQYSAQAEAAFNAKSMWDLGIRKPIILFQESEFGIAHEKAFREAFPGKVVSTLRYSGVDRGQLKSLILKMKTLDFDAVYVPLVETFLLGFMTEMNRVGIKDKRIFGIYSVELPALIDAEGASTEGIIYSYPDIPTSDNAATYFARLAAQMLGDEMAKCRENIECIRSHLKADNKFDSHNFLSSPLKLKTIRNMEFVTFQK